MLRTLVQVLPWRDQAPPRFRQPSSHLHVVEVDSSAPTAEGVEIAPASHLASEQPNNAATNERKTLQSISMRSDPDLAEVLDRKDRISDARRAGAVERRHRPGHLTARENIADPAIQAPSSPGEQAPNPNRCNGVAGLLR
jgi:hypothetical protein